MKIFIKENRGFTLIEILAVIILISLIVIIAVPSVKSVSVKSKRKLFDTKVKIAEEAVNLWGENNNSCFETGCGVLSGCVNDTEKNTTRCKTTFGLLAQNNIINYDGDVDGVEYVVNPIDSSNMNDYEIFVTLDKNNNMITSELDKTSIKDPEIIDIISNNKNNNQGDDVDKDSGITSSSSNSNMNSTSSGSVSAIININVDYDNGEQTNFSNVINGSLKLDTSIAIKDGYIFDSWEVLTKNADIIGNTLTVKNSDVKVLAKYKPEEPGSFKSDSWAVIAANVQASKEATASVYSVGSEKEVAIGGTNYTVRIANNSNYNCSLASKTACGFVVEFVDIVEKRQMNVSMLNSGGWPASLMYKYLNGDTSDHLTYESTKLTLYSKLPIDLQNAIIDTTVVSGHGSNTSDDFSSIDKIYLLSTAEVWTGGATSYDTATGATRQLDYYSNRNVSNSSYASAKKIYSGSPSAWWLRVANSGDSFIGVGSSGIWYKELTANSLGVAPAFRIA